MLVLVKAPILVPGAHPSEFIARRLRAQRLSAPMAADPAAVVGWFGAVQAQDYAGAKWALALRAPGLTDAAARSRARRRHDHPHARPAADVALHRAPRTARWVLAAVAARVQRRADDVYGSYEIDAALMTRCRRAIEKTLGGGRFATRTALAAAFGRRHRGRGVRLGLIVMWAELDQARSAAGRGRASSSPTRCSTSASAARRPSAEDAQTALAARYVPATAR